MIKALPVTSGSSSSYTVESNAESVTYGYNSKNELNSIATDSTGYSFTYDSYGNPLTVKAGTNLLATYSYGSNNGKLTKVTYGNGFIVEYVYGELENLTEVWYTVNGTRTLAYRYQYTESGQLHSVEDVRAGKTNVYNYDNRGRISLTSEYSSSNMANVLSVDYTYNQINNTDFYKYKLAYKSGSNVYDALFTYSYYYYGYLESLSEESLSLEKSSGYDYVDTEYTYDAYQRISKTSVEYNSSITVNTDYTFSENTSYNPDHTSTQVKTYKVTVNGTATTYSYTYDSKGNITEINSNNSLLYRYEYDNLGQLKREDNVPKGETYVYEYDNAGNIISKTTYVLTLAETPTGTHITKNYGYSTGSWGDLLTSFNGSSITYDAIGNPLTYYGSRSFTWEGRRLVGATVSSKSLTFKYNDEGLRTSKTVSGVTTNYYYNGSQLIAEETNGNITLYMYNSTGIVGFRYRTSSYAKGVWDTYLYEKNLQGDIVAVYDGNGTKKISYTYDAWGNFTTTYHNGASASTLHNPYTYRGYYYDKDLSLYYLSSRYYDSSTGRFINADGQLNTGTILGYNLFAYCENNPVMLKDSDGRLFEKIKDFGSSILNEIKEWSYSTYYYLTEWHFEKRAELNGEHPERAEDCDNNEWTLLPKEQSIYHDNGIGNPEKKYINADGREAVFDGDTFEPVTDPKYMATYNYVPLYKIPDSNPQISDYVKWTGSAIGHFFADMVPYYLTGFSNTREQFESKLFIFD